MGKDMEGEEKRETRLGKRKKLGPRKEEVVVHYAHEEAGEKEGEIGCGLERNQSHTTAC